MDRSFDAIAGSYSENMTDTAGALPERVAGRGGPGNLPPFKVVNHKPVVDERFRGTANVADC